MTRIHKRVAGAVLAFLLAFSFAGCNMIDHLFFGDPISSDDGGEDGALELVTVDEPELYREDYLFGTCQHLSGEIGVVVFYVDDFESSWDWDGGECEKFTRNEILPALAFLEEEAQKFGVSLKLTLREEYGVYYYDDVVTSVKETGLCSIDVLFCSSVAVGFSSSNDMINSTRINYGDKEIISLAVFNKGGTAYAINPKRGSELMVDEHCVLFSGDFGTTVPSDTGEQVSVVAHEILHLYGAEDYYASGERKRLAGKYFPKDIMLSAKTDIADNQITAATAFYIGWSDELPSILLSEGWQ